MKLVCGVWFLYMVSAMELLMIRAIYYNVCVNCKTVNNFKMQIAQVMEPEYVSK